MNHGESLKANLQIMFFQMSGKNWKGFEDLESEMKSCSGDPLDKHVCTVCDVFARQSDVMKLAFASVSIVLLHVAQFSVFSHLAHSRCD
jgi:hypothetical protein